MVVITLILLAVFILLFEMIGKKKWIWAVVLAGILYGGCIAQNEFRIQLCSEYLVHDETEYILNMNRIYGNNAVKFEQPMLQYAKPLCIQMNQVWFYNAGFTHKRKWFY